MAATADCSRNAPVEQFAVVGAGAIGSSLARLLSGLGVPTTVVTPRPGGVQRAIEQVRRWYASDVRRGRLTAAQADLRLKNIRVTPSYADLAAATFVIESVPEDLAVKQEVLAAVEAHTPARCVFASNTSSIPLTAIATRSTRPAQVVGAHFFWPAHRYRLVEIAAGEGTSRATLQRALQVAGWLGKAPLLVRDQAGFFTTRVLLVYLNEAVALVSEGATVDEVDRAMRAFGWAMGPFQLLDAVGLGIFRTIHLWVSLCAGDRVADFARLWPLLEAGHCGFASGRREGAKGFYRDPEHAAVDDRVYSLIGRKGHQAPDPFEISVRPIWQMLNEAAHCLAEGVVPSLDDAELGMQLGLGWPSAQGSPAAYARRVGAPSMVRQLAEWAQSHGARLAPSPALSAW